MSGSSSGETDTLELLRGLPLFSRLSARALQEVVRHVVVRTVPPQSLVFRRGDPCEGLFVVVRGRVRVYRANRDGREQILHDQGPGQPLAEVPLFDGGPYPASARAEKRTRLLFLSRPAFQELYRSEPEVADAVIRELGRRLRRAVHLIKKISLRDVPSRVALTLLEHAGAAGAEPGEPFTLPRTQASWRTSWPPPARAWPGRFAPCGTRASSSRKGGGCASWMPRGWKAEPTEGKRLRAHPTGGLSRIRYALTTSSPSGPSASTAIQPGAKAGGMRSCRRGADDRAIRRPSGS